MISFHFVLEALFGLGTNTSIPGLFVALCIAMAFSLGRLKRPRSIRPAVLRRAIIPKRVFASSSGRADMAFTIFNLFLYGMLFGWAGVSSSTVAHLVSSSLGDAQPPAWPLWAIVTASTVTLYLSYELGYWVYHWLSHRIEFLWRFHAVHHSAESLSPLTNFRVHPVDTIVFGNALALFNGLASAMLARAFGSAHGLTIGGTNVLVLTAFLLLGTLQHSHFWMSFRGIWGRLFLSPAHHQIHHSVDPAHFNRNLGSTLAVWDWLFGTLVIPERRRQKLTFGVTGYEAPHTFKGAVVDPFVHAADSLSARASPEGVGALGTSR
jgi:sterol desaturase/sphingolipid hydroxylase (fatty acid hydroxylase superfamily)